MNLRKYLLPLSSLKLTIFCLFGVMVLVLLGTSEQVFKGINVVQEKYFRSFLVYFQPPGISYKIPFYPGGYFFAGLLLINLSAAYAFRFRLSKQKIGILMIHFGLAVLILGEVINSIFSIESQMVIRVGDIVNYSESVGKMELVVIETSNPDYDQVIGFPEKVLNTAREVGHTTLPFSLRTKLRYPNARLSMLGENDASPPSLANKGIGANVRVEPLPPVEQDDKINNFTAFIELKDGEHSLGTWLFSNAVPFPQTFSYKEKEYEIVIRRKRYYYPFSLQLTDFIHETYPATNIPKNFSSTVKLYGEDGEFERQTLIYMNHPLRYEGKTFYQASYGENDTVSVLQVVENPGRLTPYLSSSFMSLGLLIQFLAGLFRFKSRKES